MSRPRGNVTSKAQREVRKATVVEKLQESPNLTNQQLANETGVSLATVKRDLAELRQRFSLVTDERYEEFKQAQLAVFELIERNLVEGSVTPEVAREWRGIRSEISQLLGLNAPSRSIQAHVSNQSRLPTPTENPRFWRFKSCVERLDDVLFEQVCTYAKRLNYEKYHPPQPRAVPLLEGETDDNA
jgi:hypothetical protein